MSAGESVPALTAALALMNDELDRALTLGDKRAHQRADFANSEAAKKAKADRTASGYDDSGDQQWVSQTDLGEAETNAGNASGRYGPGNTGVPGAQALNPLSPEVLDMEGYTAGSYKPGGPSVAAYDMSVAAQFESEARAAQREFGANNDFAQILLTIAGFIRERRFGGDTAQQYARGLLLPFQAGLLQENTDPTESASMHALEAEFLRFLSGGSFSS